MALTYRKTKGSALTIAEMDSNFQTITGSHAVTGSFTVSGSMIITGSFKNTGSFNQVGPMTILGPTIITGSLTISGSSITDFGNQTYNVYETEKHKVVSGSNTYFLVSGSGKVGIGTSTPDAGLHIVPERTATNNTASFHVSGSMVMVRLENLPSSYAAAEQYGSGSLFSSGSAGGGGKYLCVVG